MPKFNLLGMVINHNDESLDQFYTTIKNEEVKKVAQVFIKNIKANYSMLSLPITYVTLAEQALQIQMYQLTATLGEGYNLEQAYNLLKLPPGAKGRINLKVMEQM